jgi:hypothetical protein
MTQVMDILEALDPLFQLKGILLYGLLGFG